MVDRRELLCGALAAVLMPGAGAAQPGGPPGGGPGGAPAGPAQPDRIGAGANQPGPGREREQGGSQSGAGAQQPEIETANMPVHALILSQSYQSTPAAFLPNTGQDAALMFQAFQGLRLDRVLTVRDGAPDSVIGNIGAFLGGVPRDSIALAYVAGHGLEVDGENLLMLNGGEAYLSLQGLVQALQRRAEMTVLFLDACRTNPMRPAPQGRLARAIVQDGARSAIEVVSLADVEAAATGFSPRLGAFSLPGTGVKIVFATDPANVALDGARPNSRNSPFAMALARRLRQRLSLDDVIALATGDVLRATRRQQAPWSQGSIDRPIYLADRSRMRAQRN